MAIIPLCCYDVLIDMEQLTTKWYISDCYDKTYKCIDEEENIIIVKGIHRPISLRQVTTLNL